MTDDLTMSVVDLLPTRSKTARADVEWVAAHLCVSDVTAESSPSLMAWTMLESFRGTTESRQDFCTKFLVPLLRLETSNEEGSRWDDDGSSNIALLAAFEQAFEANPQAKREEAKVGTIRASGSTGGSGQR